MSKFFLGAFLCVLVPSTFAETHNVPADEPIISVRVPDKWHSKEHGEYLEAASPDGAVSFLVLPAESRKINEAMSEAMRYLRGKSGIRVRADSVKREEGQLNGMNVKNVSWQGKNQQGDVNISFKIISIPEKKPMLVCYSASPDAEKKHQKELDKILQSITRI